MAAQHSSLQAEQTNKFANNGGVKTKCNVIPMSKRVSPETD